METAGTRLSMENFNSNLQKTLRNVRLACGFSQDEVAKVLQVNRATYVRWGSFPNAR